MCAQLPGNMIDILYIALTLFAFVGLIAYVHGCALLGREDNTDLRGKDER
jgi:hypothetical protein